MNTFKESAYIILKEAGKPLHSKKITEIALKKGGLETSGKTPQLTMYAHLVADINTLKEKSRFVKTGPSIFGLNKKYITPKGAKKEIWPISKNLSSVQKGAIAEAKIAELIMLYGSKPLCCYKPLADDEGIDLVVKEKGCLQTVCIQVKSRFNSIEKIYTASAKESTIVKKSIASVTAVVFCLFETKKGDLWDNLWFVPTMDFIKLGGKKRKDGLIGFVAGKQKRKSNKWDEYLIDKRSLANKILEQIKKI